MKYLFGLFILVAVQLNAQELKTYQTQELIDYESIAITLGGGCSIECAIATTYSTSSNLNQNKEISYTASKMYDGDKNTAWVEGTEGYGIGEKIYVYFGDEENIKLAMEQKNIPFHGIYITNGYSKNQRVWKENSRVKRFLVLLNDQPQFYIDLEDTYLPQKVRWGRDFLIDEGDTVAFEIVEVYEGDKYKDTAISDLSIQGAH